MKNIWICLLLFSCTMTPPRKAINTDLNFVTISRDEKTVAEITALEKKLTPEEKTNLVESYFKFYRFAMRNECNFKIDQLTSPEIESLGIPEFEFTTFQAQRDSPFTISFIDLQTLLGNQKYYYMGHEGDLVKNVLFGDPMPPERQVSRKRQYDLLLLRTGSLGQSQFQVCAIHFVGKNLCVVDSLTTKFVDINNSEKFCAWLENHQKVSVEERKEALIGLINMFKAIQIVK